MCGWMVYLLQMWITLLGPSATSLSVSYSNSSITFFSFFLFFVCFCFFVYFFDHFFNFFFWKASDVTEYITGQNNSLALEIYKPNNEMMDVANVTGLDLAITFVDWAPPPPDSRIQQTHQPTNKRTRKHFDIWRYGIVARSTARNCRDTCCCPVSSPPLLPFSPSPLLPFSPSPLLPFSPSPSRLLSGFHSWLHKCTQW